ncbi:hypothetical protein ACFOHQ_21140 [Xanthomonas fragariae]
MQQCTYEIEPRPIDLGGGWRLRLLQDGEEVGGGVFPLAEGAEDVVMATNEAHADAVAEGAAWLASRSVDDVQPEEVEAFAELGSQPGAVGYDENGQLVRVRLDGTHDVIPEQGGSSPVRADEIAGMDWWNTAPEAERREWMRRAGETGRAADAWAEYKRCTLQRPLHPAELRERRDAITYAQASIELEGFKLPPEYAAAAERFAAGKSRSASWGSCG